MKWRGRRMRDWLFWSWSGRIEISEDHDELLQGTQFRLQFSDIPRSIPTSDCLHHRQLLLQLMEAAAVHSQPFRGRQQHPYWPMPNGHRPPHNCAKRIKYVLQLGRINHSHIAFSPTDKQWWERDVLGLNKETKSTHKPSRSMKYAFLSQKTHEYESWCPLNLGMVNIRLRIRVPVNVAILSMWKWSRCRIPSNFTRNPNTREKVQSSCPDSQ